MAQIGMMMGWIETCTMMVERAAVDFWVVDAMYLDLLGVESVGQRFEMLGRRAEVAGISEGVLRKLLRIDPVTVFASRQLD